MRTILGGNLPPSTFQSWRKTDRPAVWAAQAIRDFIRGRCEAGRLLLAELDDYIRDRERAAQARHQKGFRRRVDD